MRTLDHPSREELRLDAVLSALSDPIRRAIACKLSSCEETWSCSTFGLPVSKSTATHHFRVLREAGLIRTRNEGATRMNALRREDIEQRFPGLLSCVLAKQET